MMDRILHAAPETMMRLNPDIPPELERITLKCLDKRTDDRYQSARELLTDLWPLKRQLDANAARAMPDAVRLELLRRSGSHPGAAAVTPAGADDASLTDAARASEASELVARGWAHLRSASFFEMSDAVSVFQAATVIDPTYAAAYAGLAHAKVDQATNRHVLVEAFGEAKAAALRAVALDHESADAQAALGLVMLVAEWDWIAAERSFQRALAINPNHAEAYLHYGELDGSARRPGAWVSAETAGFGMRLDVGARPRPDRRLVLESAPVRRRDRVGQQGARSQSTPSDRSLIARGRVLEDGRSRARG